MTNKTANNFLALDVGERRVGIAIANSTVRLPKPLTTLEYDKDFWNKLQELIETEDIGQLVVGLPRNLDGNDTAQTEISRQFAQTASERFKIPVDLQDEAGTSKMAEAELKSRGKKFDKADIDALAATIILEDYLLAYGVQS